MCIRDRQESGRYSNASEVLRAGLRLLEQQTQEEQQRLEVMRTLIAEGIAQLDQGLGISIRGEQELSEYMERIKREVNEAAAAND